MTDTTFPPATGMGATAPPPAGTPIVRHVGRSGELFSITLVNLLLKVVTLGVYHFWAKTRVRRYVWSRTLFQGEAFEYTGRPKELLVGYMLAATVLVPLFLVFQLFPILMQSVPALAVVGSIAAYVVLLFLGGFAAFSSKRYLLSRTRWRSIRFGLTGRARDHGFKTLVYLLLTSITMGLFFPLMRNRLTAHLVNHAWFGNERFRYDGKDNALLLRFLVLVGLSFVGFALLIGVIVVGAVLAGAAEGGGEMPPWAQAAPGFLAAGLMLLLFPAIGLSWLWYMAAEWRYFVSHTALGSARFSLELPTRRFMVLVVTNLLGLALTFGLAYPWVVVRTARTFAEALRMHGTLDVEAIAQHAGRPPGSGEGLADALDLGSI